MEVVEEWVVGEGREKWDGSYDRDGVLGGGCVPLDNVSGCL